MKKCIVDVPTCDQGFFKKLMDQHLWIYEFTDEEYPDYDENDFGYTEPHI